MIRLFRDMEAWDKAAGSFHTPELNEIHKLTSESIDKSYNQAIQHAINTAKNSESIHEIILKLESLKKKI